MWTALKILAALLLVLLNGFFVAAEFAIVKVRATRIAQLVDEGNKRARVAQTVITHLDEHLSATQLGITLASLALGWIGEPAVADLLATPFRALGRLWPVMDAPLVRHTAAFALGFSLITMLHIVLGELVPKSMAIARAEALTLACAQPLRLFYWVFRGPIRLLNRAAGSVLRRIGVEPASEHEAAHSNEELRMLVSASAAGGHLDETERTLLDNVFDFSERIAREVMVPRNDMVCLYVEDPLETSIQAALEAGHTRLPLCLEEKDNIIGMVHMRDLFRRQQEVKDLREIMRPAMIVPEMISVSRLLKEFQRQKSHIAILVDEYGGTAGLVTLGDLIEEIVGDIQDEFAQEEPEEVHAVGPGTFEIDGAMLMEEAEESLGLRLEEVEGVDTLGGYVLAGLGVRPEVGQEIVLGEFLFRVIEVDGLRIARVRVMPRSGPEAAAALREETA
jgi:CBS domain containing-hemolysin-like protein